jgi:hypothetical protein
LHQEHLENVSTDRKLFLSLRSKYFSHWNARGWLTLKNIGRLSLSRVCTSFLPSMSYSARTKAY